MDRQDLSEFIVDHLHELAWRKKYPINEGIAGWTILNALKGIGFAMAPEKDGYKIFRVINYGKKNYSLSINVTREELLVGWGNYSRASPSALYTSVYIVLDKFNKQVNDHFPEHQVPRHLFSYLWNQRETLARKARDIMEQYLLEYFHEYQEAVLAPLNGEKNGDLKPRILDELIASDVINLERINFVLADTRFEEKILSNICDNIDFLRDGKPIEEGGYVFDDKGGFVGYRGVSELGVSEYVLGCFLLKLAEVKDYPAGRYGPEDLDPEYGMLEVACDLGRGLLEELIVK